MIVLKWDINSSLRVDYNKERKPVLFCFLFFFLFTIYKLRTSKLAGSQFVELIMYSNLSTAGLQLYLGSSLRKQPLLFSWHEFYQ